jgi:hypothetical protein
MAVITPTPVESMSTGVTYVKWENVTAADTCAPTFFAEYSDRSVQVFGVFDGATVQMKGTNGHGVAPYEALNDPHQNVLSFTGPKIEQILENTQAIKPEFSGGGINQSLTIILVGRK